MFYFYVAKFFNSPFDIFFHFHGLSIFSVWIENSKNVFVPGIY